MASLEKIKICGIRSFGARQEDVQNIKFQKPLTLILGENGCGKSTIIECLRYLTAQKEPAGKGSFVHDPSLCQKTQVKGFVKLKIKDAQGNTVDFCRQLQATKTKKTITTKSLDNVITRTDKNTLEKHSISNRCADFSYEISRIFGVSRAILENVIFCTQEDSMWPLETDQKLKEKFDQIFDSDKYNKCVNKVREKMKKLKESCKVTEVELKYLENNKQMATEKRREIEKTKKQIEGCEREVEELKSSLLPIDLKLKDVNEKEMEMSKNHTLKETKKTELKEVEKYVTELKKRIGEELEGSDEELRNRLSNFSRELASRQREMSKIEERANECARLESRLSKELMQEQGKLGQLLKEEEINKEKLKERNRCLSALASKLDIDCRDLESEESVQTLLGRIQREVKERETRLKTLRQRYAQEESDLQTKIDELRERSMGFQNEVKNKEKRLKNDEIQMDKIKKDLNEIEKSSSKLSAVEEELSKVKDVIESLMGSTDLDELKQKIQGALTGAKETEDRLYDVEETVKVMQQNASITAELQVKRELKSSKESEIEMLRSKYDDCLRGLLGEVPDPEYGFKLAVQHHADKLRRQVQELTSAKTRKEKELTELDMKKRHQREQLRLEEEKLRALEKEINDECEGNDFEGMLKSLQSEIDELQDIKGTLSSSEFMYQRYIGALQKTRPCCPLCHRDFEREAQAKDLVRELSAKIREVPSKISENRTKLEEKQRKHDRLLMLRSKHEEARALKSTALPKIRAEVEGLETSLTKTRRELEEIGRKIWSPQKDEETCSSIQGSMALLDQLLAERNRINWEVEELESRLGGAGSRAEGKLEDMLEEQESLRKRLKTTRASLEKLQAERSSFNERLQAQHAKKSSLLEEMNKIQGGAGRKKELEDKYSELQVAEVALLEELEELRGSLNEENRRLDEAIARRSSQKKRNAEELEKMSQTVAALQRQSEDVQTSHHQVKAYEARGVAEKLDSAERHMKRLEAEMKEAKAEKERATNSINDIRRDLSNQESRERELEDNLRYREKGRYCEELRKQVRALEDKCGTIDFDAILREKRKLKAEEEAIGKKKAVIQGRIAELEVRIEQLEKELLSKALRTVDADYQRELIKLVVTKSCAKDLARYAATMEYAMMTYHKQKMTRVNSLIREYWRKIYQGTDIDYIEILTDVTETAEKRRSYNYRLVQVKSDVYLDMRNRCSAGQKMLASLIIRMALAETFCTSCGILTLDEPTTNLDNRNMRNLARVLNDILLTKQSLVNTNFQLIVITHDEQFLHELMEIDAVSDYVRVRLNEEGRTRVSRESFDGLAPRIGNFSKNATERGDSNYVYD